MESDARTNHYQFHDLTLAAASNDRAVLDALDRRLRYFAADRPAAAADLTFEFHRVRGPEQHAVDRPAGKLRAIYEPPVGQVLYSDAADQLFIAWHDRIQVLCEPESGRVWGSTVAAEGEPLWLLSHPLFTLPLIELLKRRDRFSLHAAGLCVDGKGLLFPGTTGAGKSTLTLALVRAGWGFLGDDMLFLAPRPKGLRVLAFPDEIDITDQTASFFPELRPLLDRPRSPGWPKRPIRVEDVYPAPIVRECRPAALVFPTVGHAEKSVLKPMRRDEALLELVPNVLLTEARSSQAHLDALAQLVHETVCCRLETGRDWEALPDLLRELVA